MSVILENYLECLDNIDCDVLLKLLLIESDCLSNLKVCDALKQAVKKDIDGNIYLDLPIYLRTRGLLATEELRIGGDANYSLFNEDGFLALYGDARVNHHIIISPADVKLPAANMPGETLEGVHATLDFDKTTEQSVYYTINIPHFWAVGTDVEVAICWLHDTNAANANIFVRWGIEYHAVSTGGVVAGATTTITQDSAGHNTDQGLLIHTMFTTKILGANLEDHIHRPLGIRIYRDVADDLNEDARLLLLHLEFLQDKLGEQL